jgi:hypothetical protein
VRRSAPAAGTYVSAVPGPEVPQVAQEGGEDEHQNDASLNLRLTIDVVTTVNKLAAIGVKVHWW